MTRPGTSPTHAKTGDGHIAPEPTQGVPADNSDRGENDASTLIEAPVTTGAEPLKRHDFPEGGGSGGAEAFRRPLPNDPG